MPTDVQHCNNALNAIGSGPIAGFLEETDKARTAAAQYEVTLSMLLTMAHWRFAVAKVQLSALVAAPVSYWKYAYQLPSAMIAGPDAVYNSSTVGTPPMGQGYEIFERTLMTNEAAIYIDYRFRPAEANFPPWFGALLELALAAKFAMGVTSQADIASEYFERAFGTPDKDMRGGYFAVCTQINRGGGGAKNLPTAELLAARFSL